MTAGRRRRKRGIPPPWEFPPALLPGPDSPVPGPAGANARHGPVLAATGIGAAALLGLSLSARPGSLRFYILTTGLAGTWATGALSSGGILAPTLSHLTWSLLMLTYLPPLYRTPSGRRVAE